MFGSSAASMAIANAVSREALTERSNPLQEKLFGSMLPREP
jgi:hypothetical protein